MSNENMYNFAKKIVFITGASSGIGKATALAFVKNGASVALVDQDIDRGMKVADQIEKEGGKAIFIKCDVSKDLEVKNAIEKTINHYGRLDYAFNNAGIEGQAALLPNTTEENWDQVLNINLKGPWLCMKYQIPQMLKQGMGSIVNCSSIAGIVGFSTSSAYVASKHGLIGLTKTAALEYTKSNIRVNAVCPGIIETPMIARYTHGDSKIQQQLASSEPIGRIGRPEEIAEAVLWLSSDRASFVTGHSLVVDGGWVAQ